MTFRSIILFFIYIFAFSYAHSSEIEIVDNGTTAGYVTLAWPSASGKTFELKQKENGHWKIIYQGQDRATTLSGLADGTYHYALMMDGQSNAEDEINITVRHHTLKRAWTFFGVGAAMFLILITILTIGGRNSVNPD
ncbi:MAG: hypothetical protein H6912_01070 [Kordiimonadaceae bacterium]|nr:hypothetical protein [Kordiimonadaceae bacterium]